MHELQPINKNNGGERTALQLGFSSRCFLRGDGPVVCHVTWHSAYLPTQMNTPFAAALTLLFSPDNVDGADCQHLARTGLWYVNPKNAHP